MYRPFATLARDLYRFEKAHGAGRGLGRLVETYAHVHAARRGRHARVALPGGGGCVLRARTSDYSVYRQIFLDRQYDVEATPQGDAIRGRYASLLARGKVPVILDGGANIGLAALWFAEAFPEARVLAVEPDAENADLARRNTDHLGTVDVLEAALFSGARTVRLERGGGEAWAFETARGTGADGEIAALSIDDCIARVPAGVPFIVKLDIEGAEAGILRSDGAWWHARPILIVEPHDWIKPGNRSLAGLFQRADYADADILLVGENMALVPRWSDD